MAGTRSPYFQSQWPSVFFLEPGVLLQSGHGQPSLLLTEGSLISHSPLKGPGMTIRTPQPETWLTVALASSVYGE